jgi:DNA mismatch endonuclease (patch repair protein)
MSGPESRSVAKAMRSNTRPTTFTRARVAVFLDGCFWHRCPEHGTLPRPNAELWAEKFERNVARDRDTDAQLEPLGWSVVRGWEHESYDQLVDRVVHALAVARAQLQASAVAYGI